MRPASPYIPHAKYTSGIVWYVDGVNGLATNAGKTPATAFLTIGAAISACAVGDVIVIGSGTYTELGLTLATNNVQVFSQIGAVIDPASGTALIISGNYCKQVGDLLVTPAALAIGISLTGANCVLEDVKVVGGGIGYVITGSGAVLNNCAAGNQTAIAFDIQASQGRLYRCKTIGIGASYGYKINGGVDSGVLDRCTSAGHMTSGFYIATGSVDWTILDCSSGAGDGKWRDIDSVNVWSDFKYDDVKYKSITFTDATQAFNLFKVTGTVKIAALYAHVTTALNAELGNCKFRVAAGGNTSDLTTAASLNGLAAGSYFGKIADVSIAMSVASSATPVVVENANFREPTVTSIVVAEAGTDTYIQLFSDDAVGNKDGAIHAHAKWEAVTGDGFVEAA